MLRFLTGADGQRNKGKDYPNRRSERLSFSKFSSIRWVSRTGDRPRDVWPHDEFCERIAAFSPDWRLRFSSLVFLFFVLSGFPITGLLHRERSLKGTVDLKWFYTRRALRLGPTRTARLLTRNGVYSLEFTNFAPREMKTAGGNEQFSTSALDGYSPIKLEPVKSLI